MNNGESNDKVNNALERVVEQVTANGDADAYLCTLLLPSDFANEQRLSNDIYKRFQADFCKSVLRTTGESTPRYVTVRKENGERPEYAICLFTPSKARLEKPEEHAEKGHFIANSKVSQAGWGKGKLDVTELLMEAPRFTISSQPIQLTGDNMESAMSQMRRHLQGKGEIAQPHQRTLFVSKCPQ